MAFFPRKDVNYELNKLFDFLHSESVEYCILQSKIEYCQTLKCSVPTDIDIFVNQEGLEALEEYLKINGWFRELSFRYISIRRFYAKYINGFKLKLDISMKRGVFVKNLMYEFNKEPEVTQDDYGRNFLLDNDAAFFILKKHIEGVSLTARKRKLLLGLLQDIEPKLLIRASCDLDLSKVSDVVNPYFKKSPVNKVSLLTLFKVYGYRLLPGFKSNVTISFVGMDGAGKGTYIEMLSKNIEQNNFNFRVVYLGHANYKSKLLRYVVGLKKKHSDSRVFVKFFQLLYLMLFPWELYAKSQGAKVDVMITDRHPLFESVFPITSMFNFYNKFISFIVPKPDLVFYLDGDKKELWGRKKEMTFDAYLKKAAILDELVSRNKTGVIIRRIDTTMPMAYVYKEIWDEFKSY